MNPDSPLATWRRRRGGLLTQQLATASANPRTHTAALAAANAHGRRMESTVAWIFIAAALIGIWALWASQPGRLTAIAAETGQPAAAVTRVPVPAPVAAPVAATAPAMRQFVVVVRIEQPFADSGFATVDTVRRVMNDYVRTHPGTRVTVESLGEARGAPTPR